VNVYLFAVRSAVAGDEQKLDAIDEALAPPNRIDPRTGLPYGWDDEDDLIDAIG